MWVKPGNARCTTPWQERTVTQVNSANKVNVDGMARHILDVRARNAPEYKLNVEGADDNLRLAKELNRTQVEDSEIARRYPRWIRTSPAWLRDLDKEYQQYVEGWMCICIG